MGGTGKGGDKKGQRRGGWVGVVVARRGGSSKGSGERGKCDW